MSDTLLWNTHLFIKTAIIILSFLAVSSLSVYFFQKKNPKFKSIWVSIKSWILFAPLILLALGLPKPWPFFILTLISIYSAKTFFKMVGIYHRHWFVLTTYVFIGALSYLIYAGYNYELINILPMAFLTFICLIPIIRNNYKHMIQYIALTFLCFTFLGWSLLHFGSLMILEKGIYMVIYIFFLSEFNDLVYWLVNKNWGKWKPLNRLAPQLSVEGLVVSTIFTFFAAHSLSYLLPYEDPVFWLVAATIISLLGRMGDLVMTTIRKDLGIKGSGVFIIGRDDLLARVDKMIFVAPVYYYFIIFSQNTSLF